ncbi:hypothetical protein SNE40_012615 [Patella caerulea]|uniref:Uncharacterized protein n=1 Tax=Patella caerulea TaxID=87958 RepID=A0AAN8JM37_PATCE
MTAQYYGSAYLRCLNRMNAQNNLPTDTGFCTANPDSDKIKTTLTISKDEPVIDNHRSNSYSQNSYNKQITNQESSPSDRYSYRYSTSSNRQSGNTATNGNQLTNPESSPTDRYSYRYSTSSNRQSVNTATNGNHASSEQDSNPPVKQPDRYSYRYNSSSPSSSNNQVSNPSSQSAPSTANTNRYSYTQSSTNNERSSSTSSSRDHQSPNEALSESKENTAPQSTSILASSGYLGRYKPRYSSHNLSAQASDNEESQIKPPEKHYVGYSTRNSYYAPSYETNSQEVEDNLSSSRQTSPNLYNVGYAYRYPSRSRNYGISAPEKESTDAKEETDVKTTTATYSYRNPSSSGSSVTSNTESEPVVTTSSYSYRYPYSTSRYSSTSTTPKEEPTKESEQTAEPEVTTTTYSYRYPYSSSRNTSNSQKIQETESAEPKVETEPEVTTTTYSYRYPSSSSRYSSNTTKNEDTETVASEKEPEVTTTTYSYRYPYNTSRYSTTSSTAAPQNQETETTTIEKEPEVTTTTYSYRYPYNTSRYSTTSSTAAPQNQETETTTSEKEPEVTTTTYSYRYPYNTSRYSTTSSTAAPQNQDKPKSEPDVITTTSSYRYPYSSSRYTSNTSQKVSQNQEESKKESEPEVTTTTSSYRYPYSTSRYTSSSYSTKIKPQEESKKDPEVTESSKVEPEETTITSTHSYKYPSRSFKYGLNSTSDGGPRTSTPVKEEPKPEPEVVTTTHPFTRSYLSSNYGERATSAINSTSTSSESKIADTTSPEEATPQVTSSTSRYTYRYPSRAYNYGAPASSTVDSTGSSKLTTSESSTITSGTSNSLNQKNSSNLMKASKDSSEQPSIKERNSSSSNAVNTMSGSSLQVTKSAGTGPLSPALAPRSPGAKHNVDSQPPKYIFSMGSRTVVTHGTSGSSVTSEPEEKDVKVEEDIEKDVTDGNENDKRLEEEPVVEEQDPEDLMSTQELLEQAQQYLEELHLVAAERLFIKCYLKLGEDPSDDSNDQLIEIYFGLAEVCTRKSRQSRKSPLEWQWLCVHAAALLGEATELCEHKAKTDNKEMRELYLSKKEYAENRSKSLEDLLSRTLYKWLSSGWRAIDPNAAQAIQSGNLRTAITASNFPLSSMMGLKPYEPGFLAQALSIESLHEVPSSIEGESLDSKSNWFKRIRFYCLKRLLNKNRQQVLDEVMKLSKTDPKTIESQDLGSDDEEAIEADLNGKSKEPKSKEIQDKPEDEQMSLEENDVFQDDKEPEDEADKGEEDLEDDDKDTKEKEIVSVLGEKPVKLTIAKVFHQVVGKLIKDEEYTKSELLCEEILQIIEDIMDGTVRMLRFSGQLQQNLGILCLKQGDMAKGMACLEVALKIFLVLQDGVAHREISLVLIDMGNAYVASSLTKDQLYLAIIKSIREFFEKEACDDNDTGEVTPEMCRSKEQDPTNDDELKRKENLNEAIKCYQEALSVLEKHADSELDMLSKALMKLGDCYFVQTEYSKALDAYERAMPLFKDSNVFGKDHFLQNAHVMMMLGVATFMLHVYPRAASIFEIAFSMVKHAHKLDYNTFLHGLLLSLMGIAYYKIKSYHKCVSLCYQAFEIFWVMHGEGIVVVPAERFWLVCQNLYILGNSYNVLNLQHKAIKYLNIGRAFMRTTKNGEKRQAMRILNILGDCYFAQYDYKTALVYYNEALEIGEPAKDEADTGDATTVEEEMNQSSEDMALHNQLLSKSAEANISMNQYENAIEYLEQARDMQDVLGEDIKGDLVSTLYQLGQMHSMAGDVDKAIDSYKEGLEVFRELHGGNLGPEMCVTLGNLATMCYVKACICEDIDSELQMILAAEGYFQDALKLEMNQSVCVKYANFLYSQGNYEDAIMYLEDAMKTKTELPEIVYGGLEKVTLPEALQDEVDAQEEVAMPSVCLGQFLQVLSHKMLGQTRHADQCLLGLMKNVYASEVPFLSSVLGYALMEMGLFEEAAISFGYACTLDPEYHLALDNYCLCVCLSALETLNSAVKNIFNYYHIWYEENHIPVPAILHY